MAVYVCVWLRDSPVYGQMERLGDRRLAGMSRTQAGVHVSVCVSVHERTRACV